MPCHCSHCMGGRKARPTPCPLQPPALPCPRVRPSALPLLLSLTAVGCAPSLLPYRTTLDAAARAYSAADAVATRAKAAERAVCLSERVPPAEGPACVEGVIQRWRPRSDALHALYAALEGARLALALAEVALATGRPVALEDVARAVEAVVVAAGAVR